MSDSPDRTGPRVIAVLGAGNMAGAIARRLSAVTEAEFRLTTGASHPAWIDTMPRATHAAVAESDRANIEAVAGADVVILGVEPGGIVPLAREIAGALDPGALVVSVAGGLTLADIVRALPEGAAVVRAMPNMPVEVGSGVTSFAVADTAPAGTRARVRQLLDPTGDLEELDEHLINAFSAVIGSGPAYVYAAIEALQESAVGQGLSQAQAARTVPAMISGALSYMAATGRGPAQMRGAVTSAGGSTAAALDVFADQGMADALAAGVAAARRRAEQLGRD